jgi:hypothetical protein
MPQLTFGGTGVVGIGVATGVSFNGVVVQPVTKTKEAINTPIMRNRCGSFILHSLTYLILYAE